MPSARVRLSRRATVAVTMLLLATLVLAGSAPPARAQDSPAEQQLRRAIGARVVPDSGRGMIRLPRVSLDDGDATVIVALRDTGGVEGIRVAATDDAFAVFDAAYHSPVAAQIRTMTLVGTFPVTGSRGTRELRVLRAVLTAETAARIDWQTLRPEGLAGAVDTWRFYPPFGPETGGTPVAETPPVVGTSSAAGTPVAEDPIISSLIDIGGRRLFLRCIGTGQPTVILEAGYGDDGTIWDSVQLKASERIRVCSYDRAGLSRSDPAPSLPRTSADVVADLHALLGAAGIAPPYLLVGHSFGGLHARLFAATYPAEVAGLVLVDGWPEGYDAALRTLVSDDQWTQYQATLAKDPDYEAIDLDASYTEVRAAPLPPGLPLTVISHGRPPDAACCPPGWPVAAQEQLWQELQRGLVALEPDARQIMGTESGHAIHYEQPELVVDAILGMVAVL
jgi:pimeloyl-ACP methyl ester carboxylesterase